MATYLVTGAAGFIGSNIVKRLIDSGETVVGLDNLSAGFIENLDAVMEHPSFTFIEGDIRDSGCCQKATSGADFVLHQAALGSVPRSIEMPGLYNENNIGGTLNILTAARDNGVKRFVFASSSSVYGESPTLPKEESMIPAPMSPYAIGKIAGEYYCKVFNDTYGLSTVSLRYFNVFGQGQNPNSQYAAVIPKFITGFLSGKAPVIYGDGQQTRDFTYVDNVVQANLSACHASSDAGGKSINIGCGHRITILELATKIKALLGTDIDPEHKPARTGDIRDSLAAIERAKTYLGFSEPISLDEGLLKTVGWYKEKVQHSAAR